MNYGPKTDFGRFGEHPSYMILNESSKLSSKAKGVSFEDLLWQELSGWSKIDLMA